MNQLTAATRDQIAQVETFHKQESQWREIANSQIFDLTQAFSNSLENFLEKYSTSKVRVSASEEVMPELIAGIRTSFQPLTQQVHNQVRFLADLRNFTDFLTANPLPSFK